jgi:hypothetical protein
MRDNKIPWWFHVIAATAIAGGFAAVPFWTWGLTVQMAGIAAAVIFPSIIVAYVLAMRGKSN